MFRTARAGRFGAVERAAGKNSSFNGADFRLVRPMPREVPRAEFPGERNSPELTAGDVPPGLSNADGTREFVEARGREGGGQFSVSACEEIM